jgi:hypothetical protein
MGTTDGTGTYTVSSHWSPTYDGTYSQVWSVGSTAATPVLNFTLVSGTPTPTSVATTSTLGPSSSGTLTWNANGTLAQLAGVDGFNAGNTQTCNYTHDDLGRLGQIDCGVNNGSTKFGQGYSYDSAGQIVRANPIGLQEDIGLELVGAGLAKVALDTGYKITINVADAVAKKAPETLFGRGTGWLNSNDYFRVGYNWSGSAQSGSRVFRIAIGSKRLPFHWHFDLWRF